MSNISIVTMPREVAERALDALDSFDQNYGELRQTPKTAEQLDAIATSLRAAAEIGIGMK